ncbi:isoprenyl transferase [Rossellomorea marisflavi]|jgi:undecaprenyl diphosphate synthase|uniref:Isoprenyl transferase n=1 Tax=Rossellomorea marisflavi TaxID=189381 RepID=A0A5D4RTV4_9BACI|nr:isoprenyl transferase [Rossellomorea marisflavi]KQU60343.1 UDP pyrophosphate synthase [Bacillus sp. Leaf406]MBV6683282.1 isoprenyl transferase [Bacillus sp. JRC01]MDR4937139.1 isoprenyl transferase [Rossellomorea marisflavi]MDW4526521.1 isoprenyl transferase [Rossellomorea marisflavi]TYS53851.1 isoprenyl transferase [Rossellomorea marisflavi]
MLNKLKQWKRQQGSEDYDERYRELRNHPIPEHIAIIMDGNGRWAKKRAMPRVAGHHEGMKCVRRVTRLANELGVGTLTLYAFSTENWKRPKMEVEFLMKLPEEFLGTFLPELIEENVQVKMMGATDAIPEHTKRAVQKAIEETKENDGLILNFALNYGSRSEILDGVKHVLNDVRSGILDEEQLTEDVFSTYLMTKNLKDPDLLIRTSGEIRLSNFMLWQLAYTEFWFTDVLWPDFGKEELVEAIEAYQGRSRRFGGLQSEES